jgi:hypothetical protein
VGFIALILISGAMIASADHIPIAPTAPIGLEPIGRIIASAGPFNPYLELTGTWNNPGPGLGYRSMTAGSYYRVVPNLKVGAFYRLQSGARHNDDWVASGVASPDWVWRDTSSRYEQLLILDASPRFLLPAPIVDSVLMVKTRWEYNFFNNEQSMMIRPGFTRFVLRDRQPLLEIAVAYAVYLSLPFGETLIYSYAPYLELLYHLSPGLQLSIGVTAQTQVWTTSASVLAVSPDRYAVSFPSVNLRAGLVYHPSL